MISEFKLLRGKPIDVVIFKEDIPKVFCKVHPLTLDEIVDIDENVYYHYLNLLMLDKSSLDTSTLTVEEIERISPYSVILYFAYHDKILRTVIEQAFSLFLKEPFLYSEPDTHFPNGYFFMEDGLDYRIITDEIFEQIRTILMKQNYLQNAEKKEFNPANDKAKELIEKMKQVKEKLQKQNKDEGLNLVDVTSIVATYSRDLNILSIWDLTVYQLYENYVRLLLWDKYHNDYLHLANMDENQQQSVHKAHWASKINK